MAQEDVTPPPLPSLVAMLYKMQLFGYSAHHDLITDTLRVIPAPPPEMMGDIKDHYEQLLYLQPGICDQCQAWAMRRHDAYWGAQPLYCGHCLHRIVRLFNDKDRWPEPHFEMPVSDRENDEANTAETQDSPEPGF